MRWLETLFCCAMVQAFEAAIAIDLLEYLYNPAFGKSGLLHGNLLSLECQKVLLLGCPLDGGAYPITPLWVAQLKGDYSLWQDGEAGFGRLCRIVLGDQRTIGGYAVSTDDDCEALLQLGASQLRGSSATMAV